MSHSWLPVSWKHGLPGRHRGSAGPSSLLPQVHPLPRGVVLLFVLLLLLRLLALTMVLYRQRLLKPPRPLQALLASEFQMRVKHPKGLWPLYLQQLLFPPPEKMVFALLQLLPLLVVLSLPWSD